jgi:NAD(P)-dependent dehydrogenase (short-subunit alcohol dehydrogenase family)
MRRSYMSVTFAPDSFLNKKLVITGASSGLGRATAGLLATLGASLVLIGRNREKLDDVALGLPGDAHIVRPVDLSDDGAADEVVKSIAAEFGPIDGFFHSAGNSLVLPIRMTKRAHIDDLFGASVFGSLGIARGLARKGAMKDGGSIVFMTSVSALRGRKGMVAYSAAKSATSGLLRALAVELAERGIRVNGIAAGAVATKMHDSFVKSVNEEMVKNYENLHPLGFGIPSDVANAAAFLLSDASRWITGVDLSVDGGYAAK